jgi:acyl-CoA thioesterase-1
MGTDYAGAFQAIYPALAKREGVTLIPFLLDGVAMVPDLNQGDGIHPTASGAAVVADGVWKIIQPILAAAR